MIIDFIAGLAFFSIYGIIKEKLYHILR
jgi:hypothetical protein